MLVFGHLCELVYWESGNRILKNMFSEIIILFYFYNDIKHSYKLPNKRRTEEVRRPNAITPDT
jgi:hypothetical protein